MVIACRVREHTDVRRSGRRGACVLSAERRPGRRSAGNHDGLDDLEASAKCTSPVQPPGVAGAVVSSSGQVYRLFPGIGGVGRISAPAAPTVRILTPNPPASQVRGKDR
jgi:hypothetical protein